MRLQTSSEKWRSFCSGIKLFKCHCLSRSATAIHVYGDYVVIQGMSQQLDGIIDKYSFYLTTDINIEQWERMLLGLISQKIYALRDESDYSVA